MVMPSMRSSRRDRTFVEQGKFILAPSHSGPSPAPASVRRQARCGSGTIGNPKTKERSAVFWSA
jgi:hypothetical protein